MTTTKSNGDLLRAVKKYYYLTQSPNDGKMEVNDKKKGSVVYRTRSIEKATTWAVKQLIERDIVEVENKNGDNS